MTCISANYTIKLFNVGSFEEATVWLLGETHDSSECRVLNGSLISKAADKAHSLTLFTECTPSMQIPENIASLKKHLFLHFDPEHIYGWDAEANTTLDAASKHAVECEMRSRTIEIQRKFIYEQLVEKTSITFEAFMALSTSEVESLKDQTRALKEESLHLNEIYIQAKSEALEAFKSLHKEVEAVADSRTQAMVRTLEKIRELPLQMSILVAGANHLEGTEFDLSSLYQELSNHKAAILIPKFY